jgi:2-methylisocitrate lyase-like PEP mutase family enzyme
MTASQTQADAFRALHRPASPLVLYNAWDPGSAKAVAAAGASAIATGSWAVAAALGFADGEDVPLDLVLQNLQRIVRTVDLPVTVDLESGYGATPEAVGQTVARAIAAGAVGCNIEDSYPETGKLRPPIEQAARLAAARATADRLGRPFFLNARTDVFFQSPGDIDGEQAVSQALERARFYAKAGADGLFTPGLVDPVVMARFCAASPLPVNVMVGADTPLLPIAEAGVARISFGPAPYLAAMKGLEDAARRTFAALQRLQAA